MTDLQAPRYDVRIEGLTLGADVTRHVSSLSVETDLDLAGSCNLTLNNRDNRLLDSPLLELGKRLEVHLGYGGELVPAFLGEIGSIEPSFPESGGATIRVVGYDKSYRMRRAQPAPAEYRFMNDSLIAARIAVQNGLIPVVDPTPGVLATVPQFESDMAFLKARAERHHFDVYVDWDKLHFQFPRPQTAAHVLEWGVNLSALSPRMSSSALAGLQVVRGYNQELAQEIYVAALAADADPANLLERLGSGAADLLMTLARKGLRKQHVDNPLDAMELAQSLLSALLEGMYEATGSSVGVPALRAGSYVELRGVGKRFSGTYRLRKVTHSIDDRGFRTDFAITQKATSSLAGLLRKRITEDPPPNKQEQFDGLLLGEVVDNRESLAVPPGPPLGRVKVSYPGLGDSVTSRWAPCARPMGGSRSGFYALPDIGEQVLVGFLHGDPAQPYVLGSLWSIRQQPPVQDPAGTNKVRTIRSPTGHSVTFDDTLPAGKLVLSDDHGSEITMDGTDGSITIEARGNLTIKANGTVTVSAQAGARTIAMGPENVNVT